MVGKKLRSYQNDKYKWLMLGKIILGGNYEIFDHAIKRGR